MLVRLKAWITKKLEKFVEKRVGPCKYCGRLSTKESAAQPGVFYHRACMDVDYEKQQQEAADRKAIDLMKKAIL